MIGREVSRSARQFRIVLAGLAAAILISFSGAAGADWTFIDIREIPGESTDKVHQGAINALNWEWGMAQSSDYALATGGGGAGKVNVHSLNFSHYLDSTSPGLMHYCATGKHLPEVRIFVRSPGDRPVEYLQITLKDVVVASVEIDGIADMGARPIENVALNFAEIKFDYSVQKPDGSVGAKIPFGYNVELNRTM